MKFILEWLKRNGYIITTEKIIYFLIICAITFITIKTINPFEITESNKFDPTPLQINSIFVKLECIPNTDFIKEDSSLNCTTSVTSGIFGYKYIYITIQAFEIENLTTPIFGCRLYFYNVTGVYKTLICGDSYFDYVFKPDKSGLFKFKVTSLEAERYDGIEIGNFDQHEFKRTMNVLSENEALNTKLADRSYKIALLALFLFIPTLLLELRRFLRNENLKS